MLLKKRRFFKVTNLTLTSTLETTKKKKNVLNMNDAMLKLYTRKTYKNKYIENSLVYTHLQTYIKDELYMEMLIDQDQMFNNIIGK